MLLKILGWIWLISGIFFLLKPQRFRDKLQKTSAKKLKRFFFWLALTLSILLITAVWNVHGTVATILKILGVIGLFKAAFFLKAKAADAVLEWYVSRPVKFFRFSAIGLIVMGAFILTA